MTKDTLTKLRELRRLLDWEAPKESAHFGDLCGHDQLAEGEPYPTREEMQKTGRMPAPRSHVEADRFIKEGTRLFRETWVLPVLDELIAKGERKWGAKR